MAKKRDVVISEIPKKRFGNVIDLQAFRVAKERAALASGKATMKAVRQMLSWLPSMEELEAAENLRRKLQVRCADGRSFIAICSNTEGKCWRSLRSAEIWSGGQSPATRCADAPPARSA